MIWAGEPRDGISNEDLIVFYKSKLQRYVKLIHEQYIKEDFWISGSENTTSSIESSMMSNINSLGLCYGFEKIILFFNFLIAFNSM